MSKSKYGLTDSEIEEIDAALSVPEKNFTISKLREAEEMEKDAARYRWLKSANRLNLLASSEHSFWTREDGTKFRPSHWMNANGYAFSPKETLDETIDEAMRICK